MSGWIVAELLRTGVSSALILYPVKGFSWKWDFAINPALSCPTPCTTLSSDTVSNTFTTASICILSLSFSLPFWSEALPTTPLYSAYVQSANVYSFILAFSYNFLQILSSSSFTLTLS